MLEWWVDAPCDLHARRIPLVGDVRVLPIHELSFPYLCARSNVNVKPQRCSLATVDLVSDLLESLLFALKRVLRGDTSQR